MAEDEKETPTLLKLYQKFGDRTSMHGIGRVLTNSSRWKRVLWSVMFLFGVAFAVYQIVLTMNDYYNYPVTTEVILQQEIVSKFPVVTFCNFNMARKSKIDKPIQEMIKSFIEDESVIWEDIRHQLIHNNTKADIKESGHQISDMLITCSFNGQSCGESNFKQINTPTRGVCYTHTIPENTALHYTTRGGPEYGLTLELNIEQDEYLPITFNAGAKVIVHQTDEYPFPEDGGIQAQPGAVTSIEIKKEITHRLPAPYSTCVDANGQGSAQRNLYPNKKYMQKTCLKSCYQLAINEACDCCDKDLPCDYYVNVDANKTIFTTYPEQNQCGFFSILFCVRYVEFSYLTGELCGDKCPPPCDHTTFDTVVSSGLWPAEPRLNSFVEYLINNKNMTFSDNASLERYIRSNFLRIEIYLDKLEFFEFTTHAKYDWNLLLGTIGGLLGLWLGFSLLTAMEIVEVLIDTVLYYTHGKDKEKTANQTEQN